MAQANPEERPLHLHNSDSFSAAAAEIKRDSVVNNNKITTTTSSSAGFKLNAHAPEFIPRSHSSSAAAQLQQQVPISGYLYPCFQFLDGSVVGSDWFYLSSGSADQQPQESYRLFPNNNPSGSVNSLPNSSKNPQLPDDIQQKITKQVEYLFSDLSLLANEAMAKHVSKDPEGYVTIPVIASMKKIKSIVNNNHGLLVQSVRLSSKLVLSSDCKKVRRRIPFTETYKEDLQCRTVVAENLPDDHSYQNLEKIFSHVGGVKAIRLCHPQEANVSRSKSEVIISNKLHALVEYENSDVAEKAAEQLNDERNWRKGLRVRVLMKCSPKCVLKTKKSDFDTCGDDDEWAPDVVEESASHSNGVEIATESNGEENSSASSKKPAAPSRGRVKSSKVRVQAHNGRGLLTPPAQTIGVSVPATTSTTMTNIIQCDSPSSKQPNKGPRMPDGTRGFTMGRGKPMVS